MLAQLVELLALRELQTGLSAVDAPMHRKSRRRSSPPPDPARAQPLAGRVLPRGLAGRAAGRVRELWTRFRRSQRQPLRARAGALLPLRHPSLPPARTSRACRPGGFIPFDGYHHLLQAALRGGHRRLPARRKQRKGPATPSPARWRRPTTGLGFQTLADQVRRSVRSVRGNQWMFRIGHPADQPLRVRPELLARASAERPVPDPARGARRCAWT